MNCAIRRRLQHGAWVCSSTMFYLLLGVSVFAIACHRHADMLNLFAGALRRKCEVTR